jgi:hypothetical protein
MDVFRLIADRKIQEAMDEGAFDRLTGAGQPLRLDDDPFEDPSLRMAHRLLRNNGFAPWWIEESKDLDCAASQLRSELTAGRIAVEEFRRRAAALNRRMAVYNLQAPSISAHKLPLDPNAAGPNS